MLENDHTQRECFLTLTCQLKISEAECPQNDDSEIGNFYDQNRTNLSQTATEVVGLPKT